MSDSPSVLDSTTCTTIVDDLVSKLRAHYVFPEVAVEVEAALRACLNNKEYADLPGLDDFCVRLTEHMQEVSRDKHLRVFYSAESLAQSQQIRDTPEWREQFRLTASLSNFGFHKLERLPGNIGYLDLRLFYPAMMAAETAVAAMNVLAHTNALIIDLRQNGGGDPAMVAVLSSYLFDPETVHLNNLCGRDGEIQQFWTLPYVPGKRYGNKPVYVLTSAATFSGAEEFSYNLQNLKRATIIGEVTRGGAHPGRRFPINDHVEVFIPLARAVNPISGTNWEGSGVIPDIEVPQEQALPKAYALALKEVLERLGEEPSAAYKTLQEEIQRVLSEMETTEQTLAELETAEQSLTALESRPDPMIVEEVPEAAGDDRQTSE